MLKKRVITKQLLPNLVEDVISGYLNLDGNIKQVLGVSVYATTAFQNPALLTTVEPFGRIVLTHSDCYFQEVVSNGYLLNNGNPKNRNIFFTPFQFDYKGEEIEFYYENYKRAKHDLIIMVSVIQEVKDVSI